MKIDRLMGILTWLLQKKEVTALQLAEKFEVSRRTINRDIEILCQAGIPIITRPGYQGGISLAEGFTIDRTLLDEKELEALLVGVRGLDSVMKVPCGQRLEAKLKTGDGREEPDSIVINLASHYRDSISEKIALLQRAVRERKLVRFDYYCQKGEGSRTAEPYCILFQWSSWYLLAWCPDREDFRMFKLNRLWNAEMLETVYAPRPVPQQLLDADKPFSEGKWRLAARFDPEMKYRLMEEYGPDCFMEESDGSLFVDGLFFSNYEYLLQWILSFGHCVKVLTPEQLHRDVRAEAKKILSFYEEYDR